MRIAVIDESRARATIIEEGLRAFEGSEIFVLSERKALLSRIAEIEPDIVLMDLGNPARDVLEEYFAVSRALSRPIAMFVDQSDDDSIAASIDAGVSAYVVDGLAANRIRPLIEMAVRRFNAFARLQSDLAEANSKLAERANIDKAKRILMDTRGITEPEAYAELRRKAMSSSRRIADIVASVPELTRRVTSSPGTRSIIISASVISCSVGAPKEEPRATAACAASTTSGRA